MTTPRVSLIGDSINIGRVSFTFQRTLRIPDDGNTYPLPPGLGAFPIRRVNDFIRRVPSEWRERGGYFIPMYQREALWISFGGPHWRPHAVKVGIGGVNAISGGSWDGRVRRKPQDYVVVPDQPWLDGINAGNGFIRQFVATPLGQGLTVEAQVTGKEVEGGMQLTVVPPKAGLFPERPPRRNERGRNSWILYEPTATYSSMGLAAGGTMEQKIYPDDHPAGTWDSTHGTTVRVHIVNSETYRAITGEDAPPTPVSAEAYTERGLPWFRLYDEHRGDVPAPVSLAGVKPISAMMSTI